MSVPIDKDLAMSELDMMRQLQLAETFFKHSVSCLVILDRHYNFIRVNEAYAKACRRPLADFAGRNHFDLYPSDTRQIFDEVVRTKRPFATFTRAFEFTDQPERGTTYWDWTLVPVLDAQGEVEYLVFSLVEVTEKKRAEEALRQAALVYQHSSEAMMVTGATNVIIAVNDAFSRLMGYTRDEVVGKKPNMFQSGRHSPGFYETMWQALDAGGSWTGEIWDRKKSGEDIALRLTINTVYDDFGKIDRRVALFSDLTEQKKSEAIIWQQANVDPLTMLPNRYQFRERFQRLLEQARKDEFAFALLLIDLDQFKEVNDTLGHDKGDILLVEVARRITECVSDSALIARLGGDEFSVLLFEQADNDKICSISKEIIEKLKKPYMLGIEKVFLSGSIGISKFPEDGGTIEDLLSRADQAMYAAKNAGRNRYLFFTPALQEAAQSRMRLTNDLRDALAENQFEVYYQPIVELATGAIHKAEALLRWRHPLRGMVSPARFIPLAETSGLILEIGKWVFQQSARQVRQWRESGCPDFQISVNISPLQFRSDSDLSRAWLDFLAELGLPAQCLVMEITEGLLLDLTWEVSDKLFAFRDAGIELSLDDFGTGYSSLAYLKKFDIDYLKIDRAFVNNLESDSDNRALCEAIIVMAHKLGLKVIAEGVETQAQREFLQACECDYAQGFLFSPPVPAAQFDTLLSRHARPDH